MAILLFITFSFGPVRYPGSSVTALLHFVSSFSLLQVLILFLFLHTASVDTLVFLLEFFPLGNVRLPPAVSRLSVQLKPPRCWHLHSRVFSSLFLRVLGKMTFTLKE